MEACPRNWGRGWEGESVPTHQGVPGHRQVQVPVCSLHTWDPYAHPVPLCGLWHLLLLLQMYTAAINACTLYNPPDMRRALDVYAQLQRHDVEPDDLLYGNLIALAGRSRQLDVAFDLVQDMREGGLRPGMATCSALIYACISNGNLPAARKVYDTLQARSVVPHISQYNALMEQYALRFRLGTVVSLLGQMVEAGLKTNANTFRILVLAAQRADQAELAFELYQVAKARGYLRRVRHAEMGRQGGWRKRQGGLRVQ